MANFSGELIAMWWMSFEHFYLFCFFLFSFSSSFVSFVVLDLNRRPSVQVPEHGWGRRRRWVSLPGGIRTCDFRVRSDLWTDWNWSVSSLTPAISWPMTICRPYSLPTDSLSTDSLPTDSLPTDSLPEDSLPTIQFANPTVCRLTVCWPILSGIVTIHVIAGVLGLGCPAHGARKPLKRVAARKKIRMINWKRLTNQLVR